MPEETARRRGISQDQLSEEWTDEVANADTSIAESETLEERVEMELDEEADGLLQQAFSRVRGGPSKRRVAMSPAEISTDTPGPASTRNRTPRAARSRSRQA